MTVGYSIHVDGLDEALKAFKNADKTINEELTTATRQSVSVISAATKKGAPPSKKRR